MQFRSAFARGIPARALAVASLLALSLQLAACTQSYQILTWIYNGTAVSLDLAIVTDGGSSTITMTPGQNAQFDFASGASGVARIEARLAGTSTLLVESTLTADGSIIRPGGDRYGSLSLVYQGSDLTILPVEGWN